MALKEIPELLTIINKHVTIGGKKLYTCFVDFKKAFDSVWHIGLFQKMETLGLHGKLLSLIKNIYKNTKCAVKCDDKTTQFFDFTKGVRQGCPLSPILFNLHVNDIFEMINSSMETPTYLNENNKVNTIMYADDLVIIAQSEVELQSSLTQLSILCENWKLEINTKNPKCMVFNRGNKLCKANIVINAKHIENVKYTKYLGFTISSKNCTFADTLADLSTKAHRAVFALNSRIKLYVTSPTSS